MSAGDAILGDEGFFYDYDATGNVGIGVMTPAARLQVTGGNPASSVVIVQAADNQTAPLTRYIDDTGQELMRIDSDTYGNVWIGYLAGQSNQPGPGTGYNNTAVGCFGLVANTTGNSNTSLGRNTLESNTSGEANTGIGNWALKSNTTGAENTGVGLSALRLTSTGSRNTGIGVDALYDNTTGNRNTAVGAGADVPDGTASNQLSIGNLIYGTGLDGTGATISSGNIGIGVKAPGERLEVDGDVLANNFNLVSDGALKTGIEPLDGALAAVAALRPVTYVWKDTARFGERREVGLIAQEVEPIVPSVVHGGGERAYSLEYAKLVPVLIGALQELAARNETLAAEKDTLAGQVRDLSARVAALEA